MRKSLHRSRGDRIVAGICGGIAEVLDVDATMVRLAVVFATAASGFVPGLITYIVGWYLIPEGSNLRGPMPPQPPATTQQP